MRLVTSLGFFMTYIYYDYKPLLYVGLGFFAFIVVCIDRILEEWPIQNQSSKFAKISFEHLSGKLQNLWSDFPEWLEGCVKEVYKYLQKDQIREDAATPLSRSRRNSMHNLNGSFRRGSASPGSNYINRRDSVSQPPAAICLDGGAPPTVDSLAGSVNGSPSSASISPMLGRRRMAEGAAPAAVNSFGYTYPSDDDD